jgi:hypothetical protein
VLDYLCNLYGNAGLYAIRAVNGLQFKLQAEAIGYKIVFKLGTLSATYNSQATKQP